jgi:hypothetical protein
MPWSFSPGDVMKRLSIVALLLSFVLALGCANSSSTGPTAQDEKTPPAKMKGGKPVPSEND